MGCRGNHCNNYYTPCVSVGSKCGGFGGGYGTYRCSGHTGKRQSNVGDFNNYTDPVSGEKRPYQTGDIVKNPDINKLRSEIIRELDTRKKHSLYSSLKTQTVISEVKTGVIIDHNQQNSLADAVRALAKSANANEYYGDNSLGIKNESQHLVVNGDVLSAQDLISLEEDLDAKRFNDNHDIVGSLSAIIQDCICYQDCSLYEKGGQFVCSCYGYCCHYGQW